MTEVPAAAIIESVSSYINRFLETEIRDYVYARSESPVTEPLLYSYLAGGKRIRPVLLCVTAGFIPGLLTESDVKNPSQSQRGILFAAAAVEAIHTYSLIHDDLPSMDNDDYRRGRPSCHRQFSEWKAVLAGDALNTLAFELLLATENPDKFRKLTEILSKAAGIGGMICGQTLDVMAEKEGAFLRGMSTDAKKELLKKIHKNKTGALLRASLEMGAVIADYPCISQVSSYGELAGLLFQITDDILDVEGDFATLGKTAGKDAASGKLTYPQLYGLEESRELAKDTALRAKAAAEEIDLPFPESSGSAGEAVRGFFKELPDFILHRKK